MDLLNLPTNLSPTIFYKTISEKFKIHQNIAILPGKTDIPIHIYTDSTSITNYSVYLSTYKEYEKTLVFHPFSLINKPNIKNIGIIEKSPGLIYTSIKDTKAIEDLFYKNTKEQVTVIKTDKVKNYCFIQWDFNKINYSTQLSFLSTFLGKLYEDIFVLG
jgi:hypothetical protein